jgi:hypothetical protein
MRSKLALCYEKLGNPNLSYEYLDKGLSSDEAVAEDFILLCKYALAQTQFPQEGGNISSFGNNNRFSVLCVLIILIIVLPPILDRLVKSSGFHASLLTELLGYCYQVSIYIMLNRNYFDVYITFILVWKKDCNINQCITSCS